MWKMFAVHTWRPLQKKYFIPDYVDLSEAIYETHLA